MRDPYLLTMADMGMANGDHGGMDDGAMSGSHTNRTGFPGGPDMREWGHGDDEDTGEAVPS